MSLSERIARAAGRRLATASAGLDALRREALDEFTKARGGGGGETMSGETAAGGAQRPAPQVSDLREVDPRLPGPLGAEDEPKSLMWDPYALVEQLGYKEKPSPITYGTLQAMVWKVPIIHAIIQTRVNQAASFATPQAHRFDPGFRVRLRDAKAKPTRADRKFIEEMERVIMQCGVTADSRGRDGFESFLRKILRDSLIYDQACFEVVPGRDGRPSEWYAIDGATIRKADTRSLYPSKDLDEVAYVQVYDNTVITEYTAQELAFMVRNPRTDIRAQGYGISELEMLISTVTSILYAWNYNQHAFAQGSLQKGMLNLKGAIPEAQLRAFRRQWYQQVAGVENAWRTPITNAEGLEWVNMQASNKDMEYSAWMDFLIKVACSIYQMDPIEVNFKYGAGGSKSMFDTGNRSKMVESKDRGLRPLLRSVGRQLDTSIIWPINPDFTLEFVGLDAQTPKELADLNTQRVRTIYTIDEVRAENDLPPLPDGKGDIILDTNWIAHTREVDAAKEQRRQQALQAAQAAGAAAQAGLPGGTGDPSTEAPGGPGGASGAPTPAGAQAAIPQGGGQAPGAIPGQGGQGGVANPEAPKGPDKDQIAELEGYLKPSHTTSPTSVKKSLHEDGAVELRIEL